MTPDYRLQGGWYTAPGYCPLPKLIVNTVGIDFFVTVDSVELDCEEIHDLSGVMGFARVENLYINQFVHDVGAFEVLRDLPRLRSVTMTKSCGLTVDEIGLISNSLKGVDVVAE